MQMNQPPHLPSDPAQGKPPVNTNRTLPAGETLLIAIEHVVGRLNSGSFTWDLMLVIFDLILGIWDLIGSSLSIQRLLVVLLSLNALLLLLPRDLKRRLKVSWDIFWPPWKDRTAPISVAAGSSSDKGAQSRLRKQEDAATPMNASISTSMPKNAEEGQSKGVVARTRGAMPREANERQVQKEARQSADSLGPSRIYKPVEPTTVAKTDGVDLKMPKAARDGTAGEADTVGSQSGQVASGRNSEVSREARASSISTDDPKTEKKLTAKEARRTEAREEIEAKGMVKNYRGGGSTPFSPQPDASFEASAGQKESAETTQKPTVPQPGVRFRGTPGTTKVPLRSVRTTTGSDGEAPRTVKQPEVAVDSSSDTSRPTTPSAAITDDPLMAGDYRPLKSAMKKSKKKPRQKKNIHHNYFMTMRGWRPALVPFPHGLHPRPHHPRHTLWWDNIPKDADHIMALPKIAKEPEPLRPGEESDDGSAMSSNDSKADDIADAKGKSGEKAPEAVDPRSTRSTISGNGKPVKKADSSARPAKIENDDVGKHKVAEKEAALGKAKSAAIFGQDADEAKAVERAKALKDAKDKEKARAVRKESSLSPFLGSQLPPPPTLDTQLQKATWVTQGVLCVLLLYIHEQLAIVLFGFFMWQYMQDKAAREAGMKAFEGQQASAKASKQSESSDSNAPPGKETSRSKSETSDSTGARAVDNPGNDALKRKAVEPSLLANPTGSPSTTPASSRISPEIQAKLAKMPPEKRDKYQAQLLAEQRKISPSNSRSSGIGTENERMRIPTPPPTSNENEIPDAPNSGDQKPEDVTSTNEAASPKVSTGDQPVVLPPKIIAKLNTLPLEERAKYEAQYLARLQGLAKGYSGAASSRTAAEGKPERETVPETVAHLSSPKNPTKDVDAHEDGQKSPKVAQNSSSVDPVSHRGLPPEALRMLSKLPPEKRAEYDAQFLARQYREASPNKVTESSEAHAAKSPGLPPEIEKKLDKLPPEKRAKYAAKFSAERPVKERAGPMDFIAQAKAAGLPSSLISKLETMSEEEGPKYLSKYMARGKARPDACTDEEKPEAKGPARAQTIVTKPTNEAVTISSPSQTGGQAGSTHADLEGYTSPAEILALENQKKLESSYPVARAKYDARIVERQGGTLSGEDCASQGHSAQQYAPEIPSSSNGSSSPREPKQPTKEGSPVVSTGSEQRMKAKPIQQAPGLEYLPPEIQAKLNALPEEKTLKYAESLMKQCAAENAAGSLNPHHQPKRPAVKAALAREQTHKEEMTVSAANVGASPADRKVSPAERYALEQAEAKRRDGLKRRAAGIAPQQTTRATDHDTQPQVLGNGADVISKKSSIDPAGIETDAVAIPPSQFDFLRLNENPGGSGHRSNALETREGDQEVKEKRKRLEALKAQRRLEKQHLAAQSTSPAPVADKIEAADAKPGLASTVEDVTDEDCSELPGIGEAETDAVETSMSSIALSRGTGPLAGNSSHKATKLAAQSRTETDATDIQTAKGAKSDRDSSKHLSQFSPNSIYSQASYRESDVIRPLRSKESADISAARRALITSEYEHQRPWPQRNSSVEECGVITFEDEGENPPESAPPGITDFPITSTTPEGRPPLVPISTGRDHLSSAQEDIRSPSKGKQPMSPIEVERYEKTLKRAESKLSASKSLSDSKPKAKSREEQLAKMDPAMRAKYERYQAEKAKSKARSETRRRSDAGVKGEIKQGGREEVPGLAGAERSPGAWDDVASSRMTRDRLKRKEDGTPTKRLEDLTPADVEKMQKAREKRRVETAQTAKAALGKGGSGLKAEDREVWMSA